MARTPAISLSPLRARRIAAVATALTSSAPIAQAWAN